LHRCLLTRRCFIWLTIFVFALEMCQLNLNDNHPKCALAKKMETMYMFLFLQRLNGPVKNISNWYSLA
jgi:hypothetical protein